MSNWYMLTVVGRDRPGIVSQVTLGLYIKAGETLERPPWFVLEGILALC